MPHYKDGTPAKVGDVVHGRGYNVTYPITGVVVHVQPEQQACNLKVAHARPADFGSGPVPVIDVEYGETAAFEKVG